MMREINTYLTARLVAIADRMAVNLKIGASIQLPSTLGPWSGPNPLSLKIRTAVPIVETVQMASLFAPQSRMFSS